jgi:hypothetical protein
VNGENTVFEAPGDVKIEGREAATEYAMSSTSWPINAQGAVIDGWPPF